MTSTTFCSNIRKMEGGEQSPQDSRPCIHWWKYRDINRNRLSQLDVERYIMHFIFWSLISFKTHRIEKMFWHIVLLSDFHSGDKTRESWLPSKQAYPTNKRPKLHVHLPPSKKYPKDSNKAIQSPHSSSLTPLTSPQKSPLTQPYPPSFPSHSSQTTP